MALSGVFGPEAEWPRQDLIALSTEFDADLVAEAYRAGVFPMPLHDAGWPPDAMGWWSPVHRGILPLDDLRITRSLRKSAKHYVVTVDADFDAVIRRCADPARPSGWIDEAIISVYTELNRLGVAHSVEAWTPAGDLAGGLYGVSLGGLFAGESMFHDAALGRDASKVALLGLASVLDDETEGRLLDVQWVTDHLATLGAVAIDRVDYLRLVSEALAQPAPDWGRATQGAISVTSAWRA
ncbi:leucyl/phenylalanyl-tRNA--protein transferase [Propioniciclava flava]|uniref:Leucyl/phenylalanyl-tRNA--protein transferase n=1 Tax=Propioniciclava flava TaxID=2072026 RepID=A0A4Q2EE30_9ACTN|nr:leucyl/phenylalanyl-tRNA--protein transferase [Propioniciclava flava]RXW31429.1 leucyl/phenylalanyl-tRNA--protein transferase [Propioniciclava flava]